MDKIENEENLIKWTPISSGIDVRHWGRENNVSEKQFYYWERRIKGKDFEIQKETQSQNQVNFVEIQTPIDSSISRSIPTFRTDVVIHVGNNVLEISNAVSENLLSMVLKVMTNVK